MWHWARRRSKDGTAKIGLGLAEDCEAFLAGRYAEHLQDLGCPVPTWAWLNGLAHGDRARLESLAGGRLTQLGWPRTGLRLAGTWPSAVAFLAGEILDLVRSGRAELSQLQHRVLRPLEEDVWCRPEQHPHQPNQLVSSVLADLHHHRAAARRDRLTGNRGDTGAQA